MRNVWCMAKSVLRLSLVVGKKENNPKEMMYKMMLYKKTWRYGSLPFVSASIGTPAIWIEATGLHVLVIVAYHAGQVLLNYINTTLCLFERIPYSATPLAVYKYTEYKTHHQGTYPIGFVSYISTNWVNICLVYKRKSNFDIGRSSLLKYELPSHYQIINMGKFAPNAAAKKVEIIAHFAHLI